MFYYYISFLPPLRLRRFGQTLRAQRSAEMQLGNFRQFASATTGDFLIIEIPSNRNRRIHF
jgi:hypothetical protein